MKTVQLVALLLLGCVAGSRAETTNYKVDSLKRLLQSHQVKDRAEVLWNIAYELFDVDNPQALFYAERAYQEVWAKGDSLQIVKVGTTYGQLLRRVGEINQSIYVSSELLKIASRHDFGKYRKKLLNSLFASYSQREEFARALELIYETMFINELESDSIGMALSILNIGYVLYRTSDFQSSIHYSRHARRLAVRFSITENEANALFNIASAYAGMGKHDSAQYFYRHSLSKAVEHNLVGQLPQYFQSYAFTLLALRNLDSARHYANLAISQGTQGSNLWAVSSGYILLSKLALREGKHKVCWDLIQMADSANKKTRYPLIELEIIRQKSKYFASFGNVIEASRYLDMSYSLADSLYHWTDREKMRVLQLAFEQRANRQKIRAQAQLVEVKNLVIARSLKFIAAISLLLVLVVILAISLYRARKRERVINQMLDKRVAERTKELLIQRDELIHNREEQRLSRQKIYVEIKSHVNSIIGIVNLVSIDHGSQTKKYTEEASRVLTKLSEVSSRLVENKPIILEDKQHEGGETP